MRPALFTGAERCVVRAAWWGGPLRSPPRGACRVPGAPLRCGQDRATRAVVCGFRTDGIITDRLPLERFGDASDAVTGSVSAKAVVGE
ncbi:hypothetical protein [Streptomyces xantholiticus]|uniref:Uncharacterized protein n=1 Tax=Streptomyces xantholiticus TaxID=68285 RepID=A0ABV1UXE3_9ACTN